MIIKEFSSIERKENFIYYRKEFTAKVTYVFLEQEVSGLIEFIVETEATGKKSISIKFIDKIDYPILPVVLALKEKIRLLDKKGELP